MQHRGRQPPDLSAHGCPEKRHGVTIGGETESRAKQSLKRTGASERGMAHVLRVGARVSPERLFESRITASRSNGREPA